MVISRRGLLQAAGGVLAILSAPGPLFAKTGDEVLWTPAEPTIVPGTDNDAVEVTITHGGVPVTNFMLALGQGFRWDPVPGRELVLSKGEQIYDLRLSAWIREPDGTRRLLSSGSSGWGEEIPLAAAHFNPEEPRRRRRR